LGECQKELPALCESLTRFIHSQIIITTIERPSRTSPGEPSLVCALHLTNCPLQPPHNARVVRCKVVSMWPVDTGSPAAEVGEAHPPSEPVRTTPHVPVRRERMASISVQTWLRWLRPITSGHQQLDTERWIGSDQMLNVEWGIGDNERSNIGTELGSKYWVLNQGKNGGTRMATYESVFFSNNQKTHERLICGATACSQTRTNISPNHDGAETKILDEQQRRRTVYCAPLCIFVDRVPECERSSRADFSRADRVFIKVTRQQAFLIGQGTWQMNRSLSGPIA
jgi:hypothetical protein